MTTLTFFVILIVWGVCLQYILEKGRGFAGYMREKRLPEPVVALVSVAMATVILVGIYVFCNHLVEVVFK